MINKIFKVMLISLVCFVMCPAMTACFKDKKPVKNIVEKVEVAPKTKAPQVVTLAPDEENEAKGVTLGEVNGNVYSNDYFGFEFTFPDDWEKVWSREELMKFAKLLARVDLSDEIDLVEQDSLFLFMAANVGEMTHSVIDVHAYKIGSATGVFGEIKTAEEFIKDNMGFEGEDADKIKLDDIKTVKLGSKEFKCWKQSLPLNIEQAYMYACEENGYIIVFTASTDYDKAIDDIEHFINSINFE